MTADSRQMVACKILDHLRERNLSRLWLAQRSGMPYSRLCARLRAPSGLTITELALIAEALEISPSTLVDPR